MEDYVLWGCEWGVILLLGICGGGTCLGLSRIFFVCVVVDSCDGDFLCGTVFID